MQIFKDATLYFSHGTPNLATIIPAMDHIDKVLATSAGNASKFSPTIRAALTIGKTTMNKYYNLTDQSEVYRIAMGMCRAATYTKIITNTLFSVLHPCHKLEYFKKCDWEAVWIDSAHQIVCDEFDQSYSSLDVAGDGTDMQVDTDTVVSRHCLLKYVLIDFLFEILSEYMNIFDNLPDLAQASSDRRDELDCYLASDVENVTDALMWWYERRAAFPRLSRMAQDYLSILGEVSQRQFIILSLMLILLVATTVEVEHTFSQGRLVLPHIRNHLSSQSTCTLMCVGNWSLVGLVKGKDILSVLGDELIGDEDELPEGWDKICL